MLFQQASSKIHVFGVPKHPAVGAELLGRVNLVHEQRNWDVIAHHQRRHLGGDGATPVVVRDHTERGCGAGPLPRSQSTSVRSGITPLSHRKRKWDSNTAVLMVMLSVTTKPRRWYNSMERPAQRLAASRRAHSTAWQSQQPRRRQPSRKANAAARRSPIGSKRTTIFRLADPAPPLALPPYLETKTAAPAANRISPMCPIEPAACETSGNMHKKDGTIYAFPHASSDRKAFRRWGVNTGEQFTLGRLVLSADQSAMFPKKIIVAAIILLGLSGDVAAYLILSKPALPPQFAGSNGRLEANRSTWDWLCFDTQPVKQAIRGAGSGATAVRRGIWTRSDAT